MSDPRESRADLLTTVIRDHAREQIVVRQITDAQIRRWSSPSRRRCLRSGPDGSWRNV